MPSSEIYEKTIAHFLAPVLPLLNRGEVTEIMVTGPNLIYFEENGRLHQFDGRFPDERSLMAAVQNIAEFVGRRLDEDHHSMDARLPNGSRVHAILPPSSRRGICLTIRKFQPATFNLDRLVKRDSLSAEAAEFLRICVLLRKNIVISGGTGTGKTSMLNALSAAVPETERIVVIEDSSELQLNQTHTVYLEAQPPRPNGRGGVTIRDLFVDSLRMRPDRIIVGEVRRGEALDLVQSMISGHAGSLTTVHANSPRHASSRLETLCLMSDTSLPVHVARTQVASAIDVVLQLSRMSDGSRRVTAISESLGLDDGDRYQWRDLFGFQGAGTSRDGRIQGKLVRTGMRPTFESEPFHMGFGEHVTCTTDLFSFEAVGVDCQQGDLQNLQDLCPVSGTRGHLSGEQEAPLLPLSAKSCLEQQNSLPTCLRCILFSTLVWQPNEQGPLICFASAAVDSILMEVFRWVR